MCNVDKAAIERGAIVSKEKYLCKITVIKIEFYTDLYNEYPHGDATPCGKVKLGQEFITENRWTPPEGFCIWAWRDIVPLIQWFHEGREEPFICCCTDALRPVTFKLERVEITK